MLLLKTSVDNKVAKTFLLEKHTTLHIGYDVSIYLCAGIVRVKGWLQNLVQFCFKRLKSTTLVTVLVVAFSRPVDMKSVTLHTEETN
jgi:hypothetical protein